MPIKLEDLHKAQPLAVQLTTARRALLRFETGRPHHSTTMVQLGYVATECAVAEIQHIYLDHENSAEMLAAKIAIDTVGEILKARVMRLETELLTLGVDVGAPQHTSHRS